MNTTTQASRFIPITNPDLRFMGRIDRTPADHQTWAFPYTQVSFRCTGTSIGVRLVNHWGYGDAYLGAIIDGMQVKARVPIDGAHDGISMENGYPSRVEPTGQQDDGPRHPVDVAIAADLPNIEHEVTIFKRQDEGNNRFDVYGILLDEGAKLMPTATPLPERRIEVYGDSVTCGERCEAACYVGQADPEVDLSPYSNAWYSYAAITARNLGAQAHLVSQGGTTLLDGIGWFHARTTSAWKASGTNPSTTRSWAARPLGISRNTRRMSSWSRWVRTMRIPAISWRTTMTARKPRIGGPGTSISCTRCAENIRMR